MSVEKIEDIMDRAVIIVDNVAFEIDDSSNVQSKILAINLDDTYERAVFVERRGEFILAAPSFRNDIQRDMFMRAIRNNTSLL